jgi:general secretion pathway protein B
MSYILDALRKAAEQRGSTGSVLFRPTPVQIGVSRTWRAPWVVVGGLLIVNAAVLAWLFRPMGGPDLPPPTASESSTTPGVTLAIPSAPPSAPAPSAVVPSAAPAVPAALVPPPHAPAIRPAPKTAPPPGHRVTASRAMPTEPRVLVPERPNAQPAVEPTAAPRSGSRAGVIEPLPPSTAPVPPAGSAARADRGKLKLEVVSFSDTPAQRLVFISGRKYVEGDTTDGGFRVEQIKEDSVVLSDQGGRFTLR